MIKEKPTGNELRREDPSASVPESGPADSISLPYRDRVEGGQVLAVQLDQYANRSDVIVLALPRGGVPVGYEVARALAAPLDVFVVRKLGVPGHEELAMGAIASDTGQTGAGTIVLNEDAVRGLGISDEAIEAVAEQERRELERRERLYRGDKPALKAHGNVVILVDDGLATGSTMRAAVQALRQQEPARLVVGVPIAAPEVCAQFQDEVDEIVCAAMPREFYAVGLWYRDFSQTSDDEVCELLERANKRGSTD